MKKSELLSEFEKVENLASLTADLANSQHHEAASLAIGRLNAAIGAFKKKIEDIKEPIVVNPERGQPVVVNRAVADPAPPKPLDAKPIPGKQT